MIWLLKVELHDWSQKQVYICSDKSEFSIFFVARIRV